MRERRPGHDLRQISSGLWQLRFHFPAPVNCWFLLDSDGLTLIDAAHPWNAEDILLAAGKIGQPLRRIVITHAHPDHAGAAAELSSRTGAAVYVHEEDFPYLSGESSMADLPGFPLCRTVLKIGRRLGILHPPPVEGLRCVGEGERIGSLQVMHTPGHTPGSISLWVENEKAIFCGDNLFADQGLRFGLPWFSLDLPRRNSCVERYLTLPACMILSGHGPVYEGDGLSKDLRKLLPR